MDWIVVHYKEIGVKGRNRIRFELCLMDHLTRVLGGGSAHPPAVRRFHGRILVRAGADLFARQEVDARLSSVPGVANFARARVTELDLDAMSGVAIELASAAAGASFRIRTRRSNKRFPHTSVGVNEILGAAVAVATGKSVRLVDPDLTVWVEVTEREAIIYTERQAGLGGLPIGVGGTIVGLLSGGIDSPVAAFKMMRRGARVVLLHFHNYSRYQDEVRRKLVELAQVLTRFQLRSRLYIVPFADVQEALVAAIPAEARMVAYRRAMLRIGARVLALEGAQAFVTGDSLGQVASQTLHNLAAVYAAAAAPVLTPLVAEDKDSIIELARRIGTYEISIRPYEDCCSFLIARHPNTRVSVARLTHWEQRIPLDELARKALEGAEVCDFEYPSAVPLDSHRPDVGTCAPDLPGDAASDV